MSAEFTGSLASRALALLGCRYPVVQTAMGWVADANLVAASGNAGGFGFLAGATLPPAEVEREILRVRELSDCPFGINFHMFQPNAGDIVELVLRHQVRAVSYGRAPEPSVIERLRAADVVCMPTVGALRHAQRAVELGANALTVQGGEGGGHTGAVPTSILLPQVLDALGAEIPVFAAGGFYDGRGLAAALAWGADGIAMGTRFLLTRESPVPEQTKQRYLDCADPRLMVVSKALDGLPQRMLNNPMLRRLERGGPLLRLLTALSSALAYRRFTGASLGQLLSSALAAARGGGASAMAQSLMAANAPMIIQKAMVDGEPDAGVLPGGQVAGLIAELLSCEELLRTIVDDAERRLTVLAGGKPG